MGEFPAIFVRFRLRHANNSILLELDENCSGILETTCTLAVRNAAGGEASASIVFKPAIEVQTIWEDEWYRIDCYHYGDSDLGRMVSSFVVNFFGLRFEKTAFKGITLGNQWTVVSGYVNYHGGGAGHGAEVTRQPREGSSSPEFRFVYWADGWAWVHAFPYAIIQGPRGTRH
ncbi:MAG: hypothetical protein HXY20_13230 [Acidobacteria bacterium]|nr:hypothetical protein [Acidobacteriota bacterium]